MDWEEIFSRRPPPGTPPGTIRFNPAAPESSVSVVSYGPSEIEERRIAAEDEVRPFLGRRPVTWVNVEGLGSRQIITGLMEAFRIHGLAMEDVLDLSQRTKVEHYKEYVFFIADFVSAGGGIAIEQFSMFLGKDFVLTFLEKPGKWLEPVLERVRQGKGSLRSAGPDHLAYALLDALVDNYYPVLESCSEKLDEIEEELLGGCGKGTLGRMHRIKQDLRTLRRTAWPMREALNTLLRDSSPLISEDTRLYLRDCADHAVQIIDLVELYRELTADLVDLHYSNISNRTNDVMKVLTIIATIFIPLSFVAGVYGMNFNTEASCLNMPELNWAFGYPFALGIMASIALTLLAFFWRRGWIGKS